MYLPKEIDGVDQIFPTDVGELMPAMKDIPEEFKNPNAGVYGTKTSADKWCKFQSEWFFKGLNPKDKLVPVDGIDPALAIRHLATIQGSWEPKHEHKMAAVAYLASLWFKDWKPAPRA